MGSSSILIVCIVLITLGIWAGLFFFIWAMLQLRRASTAVEILAYRIDESTSSLRETATKVGDFASNVRSGWMRALELVLATAATMWPNKRSEERAGAKKTSRHYPRREENGA